MLLAAKKFRGLGHAVAKDTIQRMQSKSRMPEPVEQEPIVEESNPFFLKVHGQAP
jgi:hypothetical protein